MFKQLYFKSAEDFIAQVKIGYKLAGYFSGQTVTVTAVGSTRFLYLDAHGDERVSKFLSPMANWRFPKEDAGTPEPTPEVIGAENEE